MAASNYVHLGGGLVVPEQALRILWALEARGFRLEQDNTTLVVQPHQKLTHEDCQQIRQWKSHLLALIDYMPNDAHLWDDKRQAQPGRVPDDASQRRSA